MGFVFLFFAVAIISACYAPNITYYAARVIHFLIKHGYRSAVVAQFGVTLADGVHALVSWSVLILCVQYGIHPVTLSLLGGGGLFYLIVTQYKTHKHIDDPSTLPPSISSMGNEVFSSVFFSPLRLIGYFFLSATIFPMFSTLTWVHLPLVFCGACTGCFLFWALFLTYIYFHPELLIRRKLNTMMTVSHYLIVLFILIGIFQVF